MPANFEAMVWNSNQEFKKINRNFVHVSRNHLKQVACTQSQCIAGVIVLSKPWASNARPAITYVQYIYTTKITL